MSIDGAAWFVTRGTKTGTGLGARGAVRRGATGGLLTWIAMPERSRPAAVMTMTEGELRLMRRIRIVSRFVVLPLAVVVVALKLTGRIDVPWVLALLPSALYALHPIIMGVLGPVLQHRRYRKARVRDGE
jgi:hypothetical protein